MQGSMPLLAGHSRTWADWVSAPGPTGAVFAVANFGIVLADVTVVDGLQLLFSRLLLLTDYASPL